MLKSKMEDEVEKIQSAKKDDKLFKKDWKDKPLIPIGVAAELVATSTQTLRLYEKHGLVRPARKNKNRLYSENDIRWIRCLRNLIHEKKLGIEGVKKLLEYTSCWELRGCSEDARKECSAFINKGKPCWELNRSICKQVSGKICESCVVYLSRLKNK